jgi:Family of unknown function (DUF6868)
MVVCNTSEDSGVGTEQVLLSLGTGANAMTLTELSDILLWCVGLNYAVLLVWFGVFVHTHDWMYRLHTRWFSLSVETFDAFHYAGMSV